MLLTLGIGRPAPEKKLPVTLSLAEVRQILGRVRLAQRRLATTRKSNERLKKREIC
jgi:hypothetical protein